LWHIINTRHACIVTFAWSIILYKSILFCSLSFCHLYYLVLFMHNCLLDRFTTGLISLLRCVDANDYCSWCHYLSCIPTSRWNCNPKASSSVVVSICAEISSSELPVSKELGVKKNNVHLDFNL